MTKDKYMALADLETVWANKIKPWINDQKADKSSTYTKTEVDKKISEVDKRYMVEVVNHKAIFSDSPVIVNNHKAIFL